MIKKRLCLYFLFLLVLPAFLSAGMLTFDLGMRQSFFSYDGYNDSKLILPEAAISIGGKTPGWHFRTRFSYSKRNPHFKGLGENYTFNDSSSFRVAAGMQKIFKPEDFWGLSPFLYFALSYRNSETKMKYERSGFDYSFGYGYVRLRRLSIPVSAGIFKLYGSFVFSLEAEIDVIPIYSIHQKETFSETTLLTETNSPKWFNGYNFNLYFQIGFSY